VSVRRLLGGGAAGFWSLDLTVDLAAWTWPSRNSRSRLGAGGREREDEAGMSSSERMGGWQELDREAGKGRLEHGRPPSRCYCEFGVNIWNRWFVYLTSHYILLWYKYK
jgi:hypothetical protein